MNYSAVSFKVFLCCLLMVFSACLQKATAQIAASPDSFLVRKPVDSTSGVTVTANSVSAKPAKYRFDSSFVPRKATIRSAILPGLGQIYNRQVWKVPLVYGAIGTTAGIFIYNVKTYQELRKVYILLTDSDTANNSQVPYKYTGYGANGIKFNRDLFRRNVDYSVLAFLIAWGLNVVDATVSAHLRQFDVNDDLSLRLRPTLSPTGTVGIGLVMNFK